MHRIKKYISKGEVWNVKMEEIFQKYLSGIPLAKLLNRKAFWKKDFYTNEYTLDPRPETEMLVEEVINNHPIITSILDLGVGTGCILGSIMMDTIVKKAVAIDISSKALEVAKKNLKDIGPVEFIQNNWLDGWGRSMEILVSNPPYLLPEEVVGNLKYDPYISLVDMNNYYEKISEKKHLFSYIYLEICPRITESLKILFPNCIIKKDLSGFDRLLIYKSN